MTHIDDDGFASGTEGTPTAAKFPYAILGSFAAAIDSATSGGVTLTSSSNRVQVFTGTFTANRTVTLPSTGIKTGDTFTLLTSTDSGFELRVNASDASALTKASSGSSPIVMLGYVTVVAKQDTPTTNTHWAVLDVYEEMTQSVTFTTGFSPNVTKNYFAARRRNSVSFQMLETIQGTITGTPTEISSNASALITRINPTNSAATYGFITNAGAQTSSAGYIIVGANGQIRIARDGTQTLAWTTATTGGTSDSFSVTYKV